MDKTFEQIALEYLDANGVFPGIDREIVEFARTHEYFKDSGLRWGSPAIDIAVKPFIATFNEVVVEWIDVNLPDAWFREVFT